MMDNDDNNIGKENVDENDRKIINNKDIDIKHKKWYQ